MSLLSVHRPSSWPPSCRRGGFALLVTIVLVAFLVLILVGLATFTRVETQVADNTQALARARQNALFGLNLALGHLQQAAGPDLRLTSRADVAGSGQNAHFTGVWAPGDAAPSTWLVSGNQGLADPLAVTPASAPSPGGAAAADEVFLVGDGSVSASADRVKLKLQAIKVAERTVPGLDPGSSSPVAIGHFAYWIGDEGVKAGAGLHDQTDELDYDNRLTGAPVSNTPTTGVDWPVEIELRDQLRQLAPAQPNVAQLFPGFTSSAATNAALPKVLDYGQLVFVDPATITANDLRARFHDATTISRAVLVDHTLAPNGGLRRDLSDSPDVLPSAIRNFVKARPASRTGLLAFYDQKDSEGDADTAFPMYSSGPVLSECSVKFLVYRKEGTKLGIKYDVQAEFWNPYASTIKATTSGMRLGFKNLPTIAVTVPTDTSPVTHTVDLNSLIGLLVVRNNDGSGVDWAPGGIKVLKGGGSGRISPDGQPRKADVSGVTLPAGVLSGDMEIVVPEVKSSAPFTAILRVGSDVLGAYAPAVTFPEAQFTRTPAEVDSDAGWHFGYAFDFRDEIRDWIDPTRATAQDPRRTNLDGDFFEPSFPYWSTQPAENLGDISLVGGDTFNAAKTLVLFELPRQEPVSVGSLQHVIGEKPYRIGNPTDAGLGLSSENGYFDRYYFSTLPRWHVWSPLAPPVLPNRYIEVHVPDPANPPAVGDKFGVGGSSADYMLDHTHAAKYLLLRGAFNINSTSEAAWRAVLAGIRIPAWSHGGAAPTSVALENAFFRLSHGAQELSVDPNDAPDATNAFTRGALVVTDGQVAAMAASIVSRLKTRGRPYATLRDFVDEGAVAAAIAAAGINSADPDDVPPYSPGWLSQADVLTALAPFITPRSDTFRVRAHGDVRNPATGDTVGRAWCEAIVQRLPELTTPASGTLAPATDPLAPSAAKFPFGRQFKIVSFRWLSPSDI